MSVFVPIPCCFDYCSFVVLSEVWEGYASCFVLFPQACFGNSGSFIFLIFIYFYLFFKNKFIYFSYCWLCWVFAAAHRLSLVAASGGYSSLQCAGFSLRGLLIAEHGL